MREKSTIFNKFKISRNFAKKRFRKFGFDREETERNTFTRYCLSSKHDYSLDNAKTVLCAHQGAGARFSERAPWFQTILVVSDQHRLTLVFRDGELGFVLFVLLPFLVPGVGWRKV